MQITVERDQTEFTRLSQLGDILGLTPMEVGMVHKGLADKAFRNQAEQILADAKLKLGTVDQINDPTAKAGTVLQSSEKAGTQVAPGTTVNLVVANGQVTVKDMTGFTVDAATKELEALSLTVTKDDLGPCAEGQAPNTVLSMQFR